MILPIVVLIAGSGYIDEQRSRERLREELRREGRAIARTVQLAMQDALRDRDMDDIYQLVDQITGFEHVYGLRLFSPDGRMFYQSKILEGEPFMSREMLGKVLASREPGENRRVINSKQILTYILPLVGADGTLYGAVQLLQLESFIDQEVASTRNYILTLTLTMILVTGGVILLVTRYVVNRPIGEFVSRIRAMPDDATREVPLVGDDELRGLAREFNALVKRLDDSRLSLIAAQDERRQAELRFKNAERLAALGQLAAGLAHEIGTPLNVIGGRTDVLMRRQIEDAAIEKNLRIISEQISRIARIVREMLEFAQVKELNPSTVDLEAIVRSVVEFLEHRLEDLAIRVEWDVSPELPPMTADRDQVYEVFLNLVLNAVDSMSSGGTLHLSLGKVSRAHPDRPGDHGDWNVARVRDSGQGIPPEILERVFDPFFTTKGVGKGSGLGMSVSYGIVREHGGWMEITSEPSRGTEVTVYLPIEPGAALSARAEGIA